MSSVSIQTPNMSKRESQVNHTNHPKERIASKLCKMERRVTCLLHSNVLCTKWCTECFTWHCDNCDGHRDHRIQEAEKILTELESDLINCHEILERLKIDNIQKIDRDKVDGNLASVEKKIKEAATSRRQWHEQQIALIAHEEKALLQKAREEYQELTKHVEREQFKVLNHNQEISARRAHVIDLQNHANSQRLTNEVKQLIMHLAKMTKPDVIRPGKLGFRWAPITAAASSQLGVLSVDHSRHGRPLGEGSVHCISLAPNQRGLMIGSNRYLAIYTFRGELVDIFHNEETISATCSPDGRIYWVARVEEDNTLWHRSETDQQPFQLTELEEIHSVHSVFTRHNGDVILGGMNAQGEGVLAVWSPMCQEKRWSMVLPFGKLEYSNDLTVCGTETFIGVTCLTAQELMLIFNYSKNSTVMKYATSGIIKHPRGMCLSDRGELIVADYEAKQMHLFTQRGEHLATLEVSGAVLDVVYEKSRQKLFYINYQPSELFSTKILDPINPPSSSKEKISKNH
ncbi:unnamed protein product [Dimorphilus gyrociliatus]|uniref:B box-type domain-containing protein n=1 Tax=Dimorphilus gyrociliatus TaxID=2664684 RepID=A0A7I8W4L5_9ANNE|nr:unnamed protein product [Dimorphilus gyrociliatus]